MPFGYILYAFIQAIRRNTAIQGSVPRDQMNIGYMNKLH
jgi:hypothetical protein